MTSPVSVQVTIHPSQFPAAVRQALLDSLRTRRVNHKFHYDSVKQTQQWLALHQAYSPSRHDADCAATYDRAFAAVVPRLPAGPVHLLGLGCGGGQKDTRLLQQLRAAGHAVSYTPCDVSTAMVLVARSTAAAVVPPERCFPFVCDLAVADGLAEEFAAHGPAEATRLVTFFGMIPNFEPGEILPRLAALLRPGDTLLFSANLAPGPGYAAGAQRVLPQYDNPLTREWLLTFLRELGVERSDGELNFGLEATPAGLRRIVADFCWRRPATIAVDGERFDFGPGETIRLFFSYRYTLGRVQTALAELGLTITGQWLTRSEEEGVFLAQRRAA